MHPLFFYFHGAPVIAARIPCDEDLNVLICTAHEILYAVHAVYRSMHVQKNGIRGDDSNPVTAWVLYAGASRGNYNWLRRMGVELCNEFAFRFGRRHPLEPHFSTPEHLISTPPRLLENALPSVPPVHLVRNYLPQKITGAEDPVLTAFTRCYLECLPSGAKWTFRHAPSFVHCVRLDTTPPIWEYRP